MSQYPGKRAATIGYPHLDALNPAGNEEALEPGSEEAECAATAMNAEL